jgi:hypothetical protein
MKSTDNFFKSQIIIQSDIFTLNFKKLEISNYEKQKAGK